MRTTTIACVVGGIIAGVIGTNMVLAPERITKQNVIPTILSVVTGQTPTVCQAKANRRALLGDPFRSPVERISFRRAAEADCVAEIARRYHTDPA